MGLTRPTAAQINTVITTISDPITVLNQGSTQANIDVGFIINRNGGALANTAIFWNESANTFVTAFTTANGATNANIAISTYANLQVNTLTATFVNATGNILATNFVGSGQFLTGLPASYSNVNVKAYTESMGFQNYSNVNVVAYLGGNITVGNIMTAGNVTAPYFIGSGQFLTGLPTAYSNVNVKAYTESMGFQNYGNVNVAAYLAGNITVGNIIVPTGAGRFNGPFNESTTIQGVYVGNLNLSPRIGFFNGTAAQNWQIDNNFGSFRWYTPGVVRMTIDTGGNLNVPSGNIMTAGNVTAPYFIGSGTALTGINSFGNVFISGQSPVLADNTSDTLTLVGGTGISITANASSDTITIEAISASGAFAEAGDFGAVNDPVTVSEDQGSVTDSATITYDLGSIISASGLIYPDQLVLPSYATASLPTASVAAQLVFDSDNKSVKYSDGSQWQPTATQSYAVAMSVALG